LHEPEPFTGKSLQNDSDIYWALGEKEPSHKYEIWVKIRRRCELERRSPPYYRVVARRVDDLVEMGCLMEVESMREKYRDKEKKYYVRTEKFHMAKRKKDLENIRNLHGLLTMIVRYNEWVPEEAEPLLQKLKKKYFRDL